MDLYPTDKRKRLDGTPVNKSQIQFNVDCLEH